MIVAIAVSGAVLLALAVAVAVWGLAAERGAAEWEAEDRAWRAGGDVVQALSLEVRQRARNSRRVTLAARSRSRLAHGRGPAGVMTRRTAPGPQRGSQGRAEGMP